MAVRTFFYIVSDDGTFSRLPKKTFYRILRYGDEESSPAFKGQRIKYAEIHVEYDGHRPVAVRRAVYRHLKFDEHGRLDQAESDRFDELFVQLWPQLDELERRELTDARAAEIKAQIEREFGWQPAPALREQLFDAALRNRPRGGYRH